MTRQEFEHIVPEMRRLMLGVGRDFFGNEMDAEDVAQDGLLQLWRYCERLDAEHNWQALALRVAKHCCVDIARRRTTSLTSRAGDMVSTSLEGDDEHTVKVFPAQYNEGPPTPHDELEAAELHHAFNSAVENLNPRERQLFQLRQLDGLSLDEISEQTHIAKPSAKSMISAARRKLFEAIKEHLSDVSLNSRSATGNASLTSRYATGAASLTSRSTTDDASLSSRSATGDTSPNTNPKSPIP